MSSSTMHKLNGQIDEAIAAQERAIVAAKENDPSEVESLQATLQQYHDARRAP